MDLIQQSAFKGAFGQRFFQDTGFAGAFYQIPDFKIVFIFKVFLCHYSSPGVNPQTKNKLRSLSQEISPHKSKSYS